MIDLETLSSAPNAAVIQIGACAFNIETGDVGLMMRQLVRPDPRADISLDTVCWWMAQSEAARASVLTCNKFGENEPLSLMRLAEFVSQQCVADFQAWAMPPEFDLTIMRSMADRNGVKLPWHYAATRDLRTLERLVGASKVNRVVPEIAHDASHDARAQALTAIAYYRRLRGGAR